MYTRDSTTENQFNKNKKKKLTNHKTEIRNTRIKFRYKKSEGEPSKKWKCNRFKYQLRINQK